MLLTVRARSLSEKIDEVAIKQPLTHLALASRLTYTLGYDFLMTKHFVSNLDGSYKFVTTAEEGSNIHHETNLCAISDDGAVAAFLKPSPFVTPLYTNPNYNARLEKIRKKLNTPTCIIFADTGDKLAYRKRHTIDMNSDHYSQILLTDNGDYLIALASSDDGAYIEVYAKQANTYKHIRTFGDSPHHTRAMVGTTCDSGVYINPMINSIGLLGDRMGVVVRYTKQRKGYFNCHPCLTYQLFSISLEDLLADKVEKFFSEPVDSRVTSGVGSTAYEFEGDCAICYVTDYAREERVSDVYIFNKNLMVLHSVSLDYLRKQTNREIELNITPFSLDKITKPITLTI